MIHHLFRALSKLVPHVHKTTRAAAQLTPKPWFHMGKPAQHTANFIQKQVGKGFKFPKNG
jgi:hypothetical protein